MPLEMVSPNTQTSVHLVISTVFMDDGDSRDHNTATFMNTVLMTKCTEVWVFGDTISNGMAAEIKRAEATQKPVRYFSTKCKEVR